MVEVGKENLNIQSCDLVLPIGEERSFKNNKDGEGAIMNSIKNRKTLIRTMLYLPLPSDFLKMCFLSLIIFLVCVGISITEYILYSQLFMQQKMQLKCFLNNAINIVV